MTVFPFTRSSHHVCSVLRTHLSYRLVRSPALAGFSAHTWWYQARCATRFHSDAINEDGKPGESDADDSARKKYLAMPRTAWSKIRDDPVRHAEFNERRRLRIQAKKKDEAEGRETRGRGRPRLVTFPTAQEQKPTRWQIILSDPEKYQRRLDRARQLYREKVQAKKDGSQYIPPGTGKAGRPRKTPKPQEQHHQTQQLPPKQPLKVAGMEEKQPKTSTTTIDWEKRQELEAARYARSLEKRRQRRLEEKLRAAADPELGAKIREARRRRNRINYERRVQDPQKVEQRRKQQREYRARPESKLVQRRLREKYKSDPWQISQKKKWSRERWLRICRDPDPTRKNEMKRKARARMQELREKDPEKAERRREYWKRWYRYSSKSRALKQDPVWQEKRRAYAREWYRKLRSDPLRWEAFLQRMRERARRKRMERLLAEMEEGKRAEAWLGGRGG